MPLQSSGAISLADIQTEFGGVAPIGLNEYYAGGIYIPLVQGFSVTAGTKVPTLGAGPAITYPASGWTGLQNLNADDAATTVTLPFNFTFAGVTYTTVYAVSNSFLTFGTASTQYSGLSASNPAVNKIMYGAADNSYQRVSTLTSGTDFITIRHEGQNTTSGSPGSSNLIFEITLYNPIKFSGQNVVELLVGNWLANSSQNVSNISNSVGSVYASFTMAANQSYVFVGNSAGNSWTVNTGSRVTSTSIAPYGIPTSGAISLFNFYGTAAGVSATITPTLTNINEGSAVTFNVNTTNFPSGTLYWSLSAISGSISTSDFVGNAINGSFTITSSAGSVTLTLASDATTEGTESFQLQVRTGSTSGTVIGTSPTITINDTSTAAPVSSVIVDMLILAGGGLGGDSWSDGFEHGGGGGAGGLRIVNTQTITSNSFVVVGAGVGAASSFRNFTAEGGGRGGDDLPSGGNTTVGSFGGSGGGGGAGKAGGSGFAGQGNAGGSNVGGGGGYSSVGANGTNQSGALGGTGYSLTNFVGTLSGTSYLNITVAQGGDGGIETDGAANTGFGGGGATPSGDSGLGGSGRVIIRYTGSTVKATGGTINYATIGGSPYVIHDFMASGTFALNGLSFWAIGENDTGGGIDGGCAFLSAGEYTSANITATTTGSTTLSFTFIEASLGAIDGSSYIRLYKNGVLDFQFIKSQGLTTSYSVSHNTNNVFQFRTNLYVDNCNGGQGSIQVNVGSNLVYQYTMTAIND